MWWQSGILNCSSLDIGLFLDWLLMVAVQCLIKKLLHDYKLAMNSRIKILSAEL